MTAISNKAAFLRVGVLLVIGVVAMVGMVLFLTASQVSGGRHFESYFHESVEGLDVGAAVKYRGVTLGQVTEIGLVSAIYPSAVPPDPKADPNQRSYQMVVVRYTIDQKKAGGVPDPSHGADLGLRARLASQGITGLAYLELDFVNPVQFPAETVPWKPRDEQVASMPSTITQVQDAGQALLAKLQAVDLQKLSTSAQTVMDDLHEEITAGDAHATLAEARALLTELRASVAAADLPGLTADLKATSAATRGLVQGKPTRDMINAATDAAKRLPPLIDTLQRAVARADDGVSDLQRQLDPLLRDARAIAANLRQTSETLRRDPASVLLGAPPPQGKQP